MAALNYVSSSSQAFIVAANGRGLIAPPNADGSPGMSFTSQVTVSEHHHDELEIETHPIQVGAPIADHAFVKPAELTLNLIFAVAPGTGSPDFVKTFISYVYGQLENGKANRILYTVYTTKRIYTNMLIKAITTETDVNKQNIFEVTLLMQQVLLAKSISTGPTGVTAPASNQASPQDTNPVQSQGAQTATVLGAH